MKISAHLDVVDDRFTVDRRNRILDGHDYVIVTARLEDGRTAGERDRDGAGEHGRYNRECFHIYNFSVQELYILWRPQNTRIR